MTTKAPETIWAITTEVTGAVVTGAWADTVRALPRGIDPPEYVRADLYAAVVAERDELSQIVATGIDDVAGAGMDELEARAEAAEAALATAREGLRIQAGLLTAGTCGERGKVVGERILALIDRKP